MPNRTDGATRGVRVRWIVRPARPVSRERRLAAAAAAKVLLARYELWTQYRISAWGEPVPARPWVEAASSILIGHMPSLSRYAPHRQRAGVAR